MVEKRQNDRSAVGVDCRQSLSTSTLCESVPHIMWSHAPANQYAIRCRNCQRLLVLSRKVVFCLTGPYLNKAGDHIGRLANWRLARIRAFSVVSLGACASALSADLLVVVIGLQVVQRGLWGKTLGMRASHLRPARPFGLPRPMCCPLCHLAVPLPTFRRWFERACRRSDLDASASPASV